MAGYLSHQLEQLKAPILVASHPRSGTHLLIDFIRRHFPQAHIPHRPLAPLDRLYLNVERLTSAYRPLTHDMALKIAHKPERLLVKSHYLPDYSTTWAKNESGTLGREWHAFVSRATKLYIWRDPAEVMLSFQRFLAPSDPAVGKMGLFEFANSPHWDGKSSRLGWWAEHVRQWHAQDDVTIVRYDELVGAPSRVLATISRCTGLAPQPKAPFLPMKVKRKWRTRWDRLLPFTPQSTAIIAKPEFRKAGSGNYEEIYRLREISKPLLPSIGTG